MALVVGFQLHGEGHDHTAGRHFVGRFMTALCMFASRANFRAYLDTKVLPAKRCKRFVGGRVASSQGASNGVQGADASLSGANPALGWLPGPPHPTKPFVRGYRLEGDL